MMDTKTKLYDSADLTPHKYEVNDKKEKELLSSLSKRTDTEAERIRRYLAYSDLSRNPESPLMEIIKKLLTLPTFRKFDDIHIPEIVPAKESFDLFDFPADHPARSKSDTYYVDDKNILKTHTTVMWYYYLLLPEIKKRIAENKNIGVVSYGKVYRKDEIDRHHMNIFHQIDGLYICPKKFHVITQQDLKDVLIEVAQGVFGKQVKYKFNDDSFPYTYESLEMEVDKGSVDGGSGKEEWVEVLGAGIVQPTVLEKLGVDSKIYNGWAFGFGLERLAIISMELPDIRLLWSQDQRVKKQLHMGKKFVEVSKYPAIVRDISFVVKNDFVPNNYFDLVRDIAGDLAEEVELLDKYENAEKFGESNVSYAYRITYRSLDRTLHAEEIGALHKKLEETTAKIFGAKIR
jgi:phenylalanyl-tRNA synthetase alpha chain